MKQWISKLRLQSHKWRVGEESETNKINVVWEKDFLTVSTEQWFPVLQIYYYNVKIFTGLTPFYQILFCQVGTLK